MDKIYFAVTKSGARIPEKRPEDAGYDIYACFDEPYMRIGPGETAMVSTGLICAFPNGYVAILKERGSTGTRGIGQRAGVIDSGYRGEWLVALTNLNSRPLYIIKRGEKAPENSVEYPYEKAICQALFLPLANLEAQTVTKEDVMAVSSKRGDGRLGSSGK